MIKEITIKIDTETEKITYNYDDEDEEYFNNTKLIDLYAFLFMTHKNIDEADKMTERLGFSNEGVFHGYMLNYVSPDFDDYILVTLNYDDKIYNVSCSKNIKQDECYSILQDVIDVQYGGLKADIIDIFNPI